MGGYIINKMPDWTSRNHFSRAHNPCYDVVFSNSSYHSYNDVLTSE